MLTGLTLGVQYNMTLLRKQFHQEYSRFNWRQQRLTSNSTTPHYLHLLIETANLKNYLQDFNSNHVIFDQG